MSAAVKTIDHETIRRWAEARGGRPASVRDSGDGDPGAPRIDFPGHSEEALKRISWEQFFSKFEGSGLALLYQDVTEDGEPSYFNAFVSRDHEMD
jgi:hypothetical protein